MADYAAKATDAALEVLEKRIRSVYSEAQKDIEAKTKDFWERHAAKDALYRQQVKDGKISAEDYQAWMRGQVFQGEQWKSKLQQVQATLAQANKEALSIINGGRIQVIATNLNWTAYNLEKTAGVNFGFGLYDSSAVTRLLRDDPNLLPAKKLNIPKDKLWNKGNINRQISQGIIQGESLDKIAKRLRTVTDMNKNSSLTNARTMMTGAQNAGRQERYQEAKKKGIQLKKEWLATLDGHTRATHAALDGQAVETDEPFRVGGFSIMYPGDRNAPPALVYGCRCTTVAKLEKYPDRYSQRYDNVTGKPIKDMTYKEWQRAKSVPEFTQVGIGSCKTVEQVEDMMNASGHFTTECSLKGCDLNSAKSIASSYQQMVERFPQLSKKIGGVKARDIGNKAYAQCYMGSNRRVEVNSGSNFYGNWARVVESYERDVEANWHPWGTTAESIVIHELGHAVDGILSDLNNSWKIGKSKIDKTYANDLRAKVCMSLGVKASEIHYYVSDYAGQNAQEWFAECFAEYLTSADPRTVALKFGELLEKELKKL